MSSFDGRIFLLLQQSTLVIQYFSSICIFNVCLYFQSINFPIHDPNYYGPSRSRFRQQQLSQYDKLPSSSYEFLVEVSLLITSKRLVSTLVCLLKLVQSCNPESPQNMQFLKNMCELSSITRTQLPETQNSGYLICANKSGECQRSLKELHNSVHTNRFLLVYVLKEHSTKYSQTLNFLKSHRNTTAIYKVRLILKPATSLVKYNG
ncbi:Hypothetical_protein [Hexamita inflata]|uniref:Hypothetical_protein n=1 Tax=Hexamita inflata TaxID=28002 RepID=A0AA86PMW0_9EUKA|nr:Hypothetical protein HINF_LOCUS30755 [Hexamita inflata]